MSEQSDTGALESAYRTVTPSYGSHEDKGMDLIGWVVFLGVMTLLFPLVPVFLALVIGVKLIRAVRSTLQGPTEQTE
jgi:hypothetical protein